MLFFNMRFMSTTTLLIGAMLLSTAQSINEGGPWQVQNFQYYLTKVHSRPSYVTFTFFDPTTQTTTLCENRLKKGDKSSPFPVDADHPIACQNSSVGWHWGQEGQQVYAVFQYADPAVGQPDIVTEWSNGTVSPLNCYQDSKNGTKCTASGARNLTFTAAIA